MGNECSHKREGFAATFHTRKYLTPRDLVEKPENVLLSGKSEWPPQPSPACSLISGAWNHSARKSTLSSMHQLGARCMLWIHPKYLLSTKSTRGYQDEPVPPVPSQLRWVKLQQGAEHTATGRDCACGAWGVWAASPGAL